MKDVNILINNGVNVQSSLELLGDMEMYDETLSDFLDMADEKVQNLEKFKNENDMPNYAIAIHALKSDARYLGFLELGDLAYDSELKAKAGDSAGVQTNHPVILEKVQNMVSISNTYLGRAEAAPEAQSSTDAPAPASDSQAVQSQVTQPNVQAQQMVQPQVAQPNMQPQPVSQQPTVQQPMQAQPMMQPNMGYPQGGMMGQPIAQPQQVYDLASGQMVNMPGMQAQPNMGYPQGGMMQPGMVQPGMVQPGMGYPQPQYNMYGQMNMMQPGMQMPGYDPMSQALYQQNQAQQQYMNMNMNLAPKAGTILVVDDSNLVANFVKKIFDKRYDVEIASDGAKAIELCADDTFRSKIKACLLDLNMPNVDGYQVLEDFYQKGYFVKMPIAVISGVEDMESIDKVNKYPIIDILAKPFNERDVQRVVEKCLAAYF